MVNMKILTAKGARNIAQTAQTHMRNILHNVNPKSEQSTGLSTGQVTAKSAESAKLMTATAQNAKLLNKNEKQHLKRTKTSLVSLQQNGDCAGPSGVKEETLLDTDRPCTCGSDGHGLEAAGVTNNEAHELTDGNHSDTMRRDSLIPGQPSEAKAENSTETQLAKRTETVSQLTTVTKPLSAVGPSYNARLNSFTLNCGNPTHDLKRFLDVIGSEPKEARYWFKYFQKMSDTNPLFAVIQIEEDVMIRSEAIHRPHSGGYDLERQSPLNELCSYLAFLQRHDMKCIIIHGRSAANCGNTSVEDLQTEIIHDAQLITDLLEKNGAQVRQIGIPPLHVLQDQSTESGWRVGSIDPYYVEWAESSVRIPILSNIGLTPERQLVSIPLFDTTTALSLMVLPLKVLIVNLDGGIHDQEGKVIPNINLPHDEVAACKSPWCSEQVKNQIHDIKELLSRLQVEQLSLGKAPDSAVIVTSCTTLLTELFTHYGSGTFFKITEKINVYENFDEVDTKRLTDLIQMSFGKSLKEDYIESIEDDVMTIFISECYSAAAIIRREAGISVPYLDKFVVRKDHQDNSVGRMVWEQVYHLYPALFWRSRNVNLINPWYFKRSEGSWSDGEWTVFWYGVQKHCLTSEIIDYALNKPNSFKTLDSLQGVEKVRGHNSSQWSALKYM